MIDHRPNDYDSRRSLLIKYAAWECLTGDADPALWMMNYIFNYQEYNQSQRLWYTFLYANSYQLATAYVMANEFPDYELVDLDRVTKWNNDNYNRLRYQVDCRYSKGKLPKMTASYMELVGKDQETFFDELCCSDDRTENFKRVWDTVQKIVDFGRYKAWMYCQALRDVCGLPIDVPNLMLSDSGSGSHRDGLCRGLGKDEWCKRKEVIDGKRVSVRHKFTKDQIEWLEVEGSTLIKEINKSYGLSLDGLMFETILCAFKKFFRARDGRYCGYYIDRQFQDIKKVEADDWSGINWDLLWQCRKEMINSKLLNTSGIDKDAMSHFIENGELDWLGLFFKQNKPMKLNLFSL